MQDLEDEANADIVDTLIDDAFGKIAECYCVPCSQWHHSSVSLAFDTLIHESFGNVPECSLIRPSYNGINTCLRHYMSCASLVYGGVMLPSA